MKVRSSGPFLLHSSLTGCASSMLPEWSHGSIHWWTCTLELCVLNVLFYCQTCQTTQSIIISSIIIIIIIISSSNSSSSSSSSSSSTSSTSSSSSSSSSSTSSSSSSSSTSSSSSSSSSSISIISVIATVFATSTAPRALELLTRFKRSQFGTDLRQCSCFSDSEATSLSLSISFFLHSIFVIELNGEMLIGENSSHDYSATVHVEIHISSCLNANVSHTILTYRHIKQHIWHYKQNSADFTAKKLFGSSVSSSLTLLYVCL